MGGTPNEADVEQPDNRTDRDVVPGCIFGNFAVELSTHNENIRARVSARLDEMVDSASLAIVRSIEVGEISPTTNADQAAREVITHMEGLMVLAKAPATRASSENSTPPSGDFSHEKTQHTTACDASAAHADAFLTLTGAATTRSTWIKHPVRPRVGLTGET